MDRLRALFEGLELSNVETFIASGNVLFDTSCRSAPALERRVEKHLQTSLGYDVATFIRSASAVQRIAAHEPFPVAVMAKPYHALYVSFLRDAPTAAAKRAVEALRSQDHDFHVHERELYWLCRIGFGESKISGAKLEKALGMPATIRNVTTVRKLAAKC